MFFIMQLGATVHMQLQSLAGQTITQAAAGEPFILLITVSDRAGRASEPVIDGLQHFSVTNAGYQITIINGAQSVQYRYQVRIDTPGVYTLGPAHLDDPAESSAQQTIRIVAEAPAAAQTTRGSGRRYAQAQPVVELVVDHDRIYVGQKVCATLRFIASDAERLSIEPVVVQAPQAMTVYHTSQPEQKQIIIDGKGYNQVELQIDMYATKAGRIVIPAQFVDYTRELPMDASLGSFAALFGPRFERKRAHTNAITLEALALPPHTPEPQLVGEITRFDASIEPNVAQQYEGLVLKLIVEGDAHFANLQTFQLQQIPEELRYYPSKTELQELPDGQRYICEYIVQGLQPGDYQIPAQLLTYFDTETGGYKTKTTVPLYVTIMQTHQQPQKLSTAQPSSVTEVVDHQEEAQSPLAPLQTNMYAGGYGFIPYGLPLWLLVVLGLMVYAMTVIEQIFQYGERQLERIAPAYMRRRFFAQVKKEIAQARMTHNYHVLQQQLAQIIARDTHADVASIDQAKMIVYADAMPWQLEKKHRWQQFLQRLHEQQYAQQTGKHDEQLFAAAELWIDELERNA
jgi:hypothetical protein